MKAVFRQAVKLMHPDRATTEAERTRRDTIMAKVNVAYSEGNQTEIERLIREFGEDPEAITGEDVAARLVKSIRRIAQLRRRLGVIAEELDILKEDDLYELMITVNEAVDMGSNPLDSLEQNLLQELSELKIQLESLRGN
jgi:hypothetical protein